MNRVVSDTHKLIYTRKTLLKTKVNANTLENERNPFSSLF